jgi:hypothetical protein
MIIEHMIISGKEFKTGDHIRVEHADSVLHETMDGVTGTIIGFSSCGGRTRANVHVDAMFRGRFLDGIMHLFGNDSVGLVEEQDRTALPDTPDMEIDGMP